MNNRRNDQSSTHPQNSSAIKTQYEPQEENAQPREDDDAATHGGGMLRHIQKRCSHMVCRVKAAFTIETQKSDDYTDDYTRYISLLAIPSNPVVRFEQMHHIAAVFDTGNPYNLISRRLVEDILQVPNRIDCSEFQQGSRAILTLADGSPYKAIGTITLRWQAAITRRRRLKRLLWIHPKIFDTTFYVSENDLNFFDIVVGAETIHEHRFLTPIGLTGRRIKDSKAVKGKELQEAMRKQAIARAENERLKEKDRKKSTRENQDNTQGQVNR